MLNQSESSNVFMYITKNTNTIDQMFQWTILTFNDKVLDRDWFSARAYLSRNWRAITWLSNYRYLIQDVKTYCALAQVSPCLLRGSSA